MTFAVSYLSPLTLRVNCIFNIYICSFITYRFDNFVTRGVRRPRTIFGSNTSNCFWDKWVSATCQNVYAEIMDHHRRLFGNLPNFVAIGFSTWKL